MQVFQYSFRCCNILPQWSFLTPHLPTHIPLLPSLGNLSSILCYSIRCLLQATMNCHILMCHLGMPFIVPTKLLRRFKSKRALALLMQVLQRPFYQDVSTQVLTCHHLCHHSWFLLTHTTNPTKTCCLVAVGLCWYSWHLGLVIQAMVGTSRANCPGFHFPLGTNDPGQGT